MKEFQTDKIIYKRRSTRLLINKNKKQTPWFQSASKLYQLSDSRLLVKLVSTFADRECHVVSVTDPNFRILGFLDWVKTFNRQTKQKHKHQMLTEEKLGDIQARLEHTPSKLLKCVAQETGVSKCSARRAAGSTVAEA
jgi:hypothetical protein